MSTTRLTLLAALTMLAAAPALAAPCEGGKYAALAKPQAGLPAAVAATRMKILQAAVKCDYKGLEKIAFSRNPDFRFTFGGDTSPAKVWKEDALADEILQIFNTPFALSEGDYIWPAAHAKDVPSEKDWNALKWLYSAEDLGSFKKHGYIGLRASIDRTGKWLYCTAGD